MSHNQRVIIYESFSMSHNLWIKLIESRSWQQFKQHLKPKLAFFRNPRNFKKFSRDQNYHKWIRNKILNHMIWITCMVNHFWIKSISQIHEFLMTSSRVDYDVIGQKACVWMKILGWTFIFFSPFWISASQFFSGLCGRRPTFQFSRSKKSIKNGLNSISEDGF